ncbi:hypothetical protein [Streptomyces achromogenes]
MFPYDTAAVSLAGKAGITVTDASGKPLGETVPTDPGVAAAKGGA